MENEKFIPLSKQVETATKIAFEVINLHDRELLKNKTINYQLTFRVDDNDNIDIFKYSLREVKNGR